MFDRLAISKQTGENALQGVLLRLTVKRCILKKGSQGWVSLT